MEQITEFAVRHPLLVGGFVLAVIALLVTEIARRFRGFNELTPASAVQLMNAGDTVVLDVSGQADFNKGHIVGARHMPASQLESSSPQIEKLKDKNLLVVCKNGQASNQAAARLKKHGCEHVHVLKGGMTQWQADNYPISRGGKNG